MKKLIRPLLIAAVITASALPVLGAASYELISLGLLGGKDESYAYAINDKGQITGDCRSGRDSYKSRACIWENATTKDLAINRAWSSGKGINENGQVMFNGSIADIDWQDGVFLWDNETIRTVCERAFGNALNDKGQVIGWRQLTGRGANFVWNDGSIITSTSFELMYDINNAGQAVGYSDDGIGIWNDGQFTPFGAVGWIASREGEINNHNTAAFTLCTDGYNESAFIWRNGKVESLGDFGGKSNHATEINDIETVVGYIKDEEWSAPHDYFVWQNGSITYLKDAISPVAGWHLDQITITDINNKNQMVGYGKYSVGGITYDRAFLLNPVPEPSSIATMLAGLFGFSGVVLRRIGDRIGDRH